MSVGYPIMVKLGDEFRWAEYCREVAFRDANSPTRMMEFFAQEVKAGCHVKMHERWKKILKLKHRECVVSIKKTNVEKVEKILRLAGITDYEYSQNCIGINLDTIIDKRTFAFILAGVGRLRKNHDVEISSDLPISRSDLPVNYYDNKSLEESAKLISAWLHHKCPLTPHYNESGAVVAAMAATGYKMKDELGVRLFRYFVSPTREFYAHGSQSVAAGLGRAVGQRLSLMRVVANLEGEIDNTRYPFIGIDKNYRPTYRGANVSSIVVEKVVVI